MISSSELADLLAKQHEAYFRENPTGAITQTMMFEDAKAGEQVFVPCGWRDADEREFILISLRALLLMAKATRYAIWSETWFKSYPEDTDLDKHKHGQLAQDPESREAVFTLVVETGAPAITRLQRIERGRSGGVRRLILEPSEAQIFGGALAELLPQPEPN